MVDDCPMTEDCPGYDRERQTCLVSSGNCDLAHADSQAGPTVEIPETPPPE